MQGVEDTKKRERSQTRGMAAHRLQVLCQVGRDGRRQVAKDGSHELARAHAHTRQSAAAALRQIP
eukprot:364234-Chlamydomonas_euryale.AAC.19